MPRTVITPAAQPSAYPGGLAKITPVAADVANGNALVTSGREDVIAWNNGATPRLVTVTSAPDAQQRTNTLSVTIPAGEFWIFPRIGAAQFEGWRQNADASLYFSAAHADVKFLVWRQPQ